MESTLKTIEELMKLMAALDLKFNLLFKEYQSIRNDTIILRSEMDAFQNLANEIWKAQGVLFEDENLNPNELDS